MTTNNAQGLDNPGPLTRKVIDYTKVMTELVPVAKTGSDWEPLTAFVNVDAFKRVGCFLEEQTWQEYIDMLIQWTSATAQFDTQIRRVSEVDNLVYYEIEERHFRGDRTDVANSLTVFEFDDAGKIKGLRVFLQQAR